MAVELLGFPKMDEQMAIQEAASAGLKSMEHLLRLISRQSQQRQQPSNQLDCRELTDFSVSKLNKVMSMSNRTGHARFRRGPPFPPSSSASFLSVPDHPQTLTLAPMPITVAPASFPQSQQQSLLTLDFTKPSLQSSSPKGSETISTTQFSKETFSISPPMSSANSSFMSSITGEGSVSNGKQGPSLFLTPSAPTASSGKPPLSSSSHRKRCHEHDHSDDVSRKLSVSGRCHCSKKRKSRVKKTIRVPAISSKVADIPADEYSWRKYGQKPIKGSSYPRGYYKCSGVRGCPARKHVERATDDPTMLIVTYEGEHRHSHAEMQENVVGDVLSLGFQSS